MRPFARLLRRLALGFALGEVFLVLGALDIARARLMAQGTGIDSLQWIAPLGLPMVWLSSLICRIACISFDQDPIRLLLYLFLCWGIVGVVGLYVVLMIRQLIAPDGKKR